MNYLCISDNACENVNMDFRNVSYFSAIIWSFIYKVNQLEVHNMHNSRFDSMSL